MDVEKYASGKLYMFFEWAFKLVVWNVLSLLIISICASIPVILFYKTQNDYSIQEVSTLEDGIIVTQKNGTKTNIGFITENREIETYTLTENMDKQKKDPMAWQVLESEYLFKQPWLTARREHVKLPTGAEIKDFYVLEYPEFCNVIAITKGGKFLMERQYRHAQHLTAIEIPAGCVEPGEDPMEAAKRELYEETGYAGGEWSKLMTISPNAGACTNYSHTYLAIGVEKVSTQHLEASEDIKVLLLDRDEVWRMLQNDEFHQAMMAAPLWKYFALEKK